MIRGHGDLKSMIDSLAETARHARPTGRATRPDPSPDPEPKVGYDCPDCGASLGEDCDVSPSGDAECQYCKRWFNIHTA